MINIRKISIGLGLGVKDGISYPSLDHALKSGIRFFDTSTFYSAGALKQISECLTQNHIDRSDVHLCVKLWVTTLGKNRQFDYDQIDRTLDENLKAYIEELQIGYIDSLVIHWPVKADDEGYPEEFIIEEIWPRLELIVASGLAKSIGVSNFNIIELQRLLHIAKIKPFCNQIEYNPFAFNPELKDFCAKNDIQVVAHSPFNFGWKGSRLTILEHSCITDLAKKYHKTPAQIVLAWGCAHGVIPIPGSTKLEHISEIASAASVVLDASDVRAIDQLNKQAYCYADFGQYFRESRYLIPDVPNIEAKFLAPDGSFKATHLYDINFLAEVKFALTEGAGFVILPEVFKELADRLLPSLDARKMQKLGRWDGFGAHTKDSIFNTSPEIVELVDHPLVSLIVQSILGWDCKIDNLAASTSRVAPDNFVLGPHQDSPFEQNPGCPLPPAEYPLVIQTVIAFDAFTENNGPLFIVPHSHKKRQRVNLPWSGNTPKGRIPNDAIKVVVPKGSAILAIGHIWHGAASNTTDQPRRGFLVEYVSSVCEPRERFTTENIHDDALKNFSRRLLRMLSNGKRFFYDQPSLLMRYKELLKDEIPSHLKAKQVSAKLDNIIYSALVRTTGGASGYSSSDDGMLKVNLSLPKVMGGQGEASNPEQLFASSYSASFLRALEMAASQKLIELPAATSIEAKVSLGTSTQGIAIAVNLLISLPGFASLLAQELIDTANKICPYSNALKGYIRIELSLAETT
jgi:Ohr subfamily peroxiredoxin